MQSAQKVLHQDEIKIKIYSRGGSAVPNKLLVAAGTKKREEIVHGVPVYVPMSAASSPLCNSLYSSCVVFYSAVLPLFVLF